MWLWHKDFPPQQVPGTQELTDEDGAVVATVATSMLSPAGDPFVEITEKNAVKLLAEWEASQQAKIVEQETVQREAAIAAHKERADRYRRNGWSQEDIIAEIGEPI